jgi:hypothetical protein
MAISDIQRRSCHLYDTQEVLAAFLGCGHLCSFTAHQIGSYMSGAVWGWQYAIPNTPLLTFVTSRRYFLSPVDPSIYPAFLQSAYGRTYAGDGDPQWSFRLF